MNIRRMIKPFARRLFPRKVAEMSAAHGREISQEALQKQGKIAIDKKVIEHFGKKVVRGPFSGIRFTETTRVEHLTPYILGTYEHELFPYWEKVFKDKAPSQCLDIGAKIGFYAIAMKQRFPKSEVIAFDTDPWAQHATLGMARENGVELRIEGYCTIEWLEAHLKPGAFILSDCEGYEGMIFSRMCSALKTATLIIELHPRACENVRDKMYTTFRYTHHLTEIHMQPVPPTGLDLDFLSKAEQAVAFDEGRADPKQTWLFIEPMK